MRTAVLIPFGGLSASARRPLLRFVHARIEREHPGLPVICGGSEAEPWSKGQALADARAITTTAEVLVIHDADSFVAPEQLDVAIALVSAGAPWVMPYTIVQRWSEATTAMWLAGEQPDEPVIQRRHEGVIGGGIMVVRADVYDDVGGVDPRFVGWGAEDEAFGMALTTLHGPQPRLAGTLQHLWHPHAVAGRIRHRPPSEISAALLAAYKAANGSPQRMRALIDHR